MKLNLDQSVLSSHSQKYHNSCVPMAIELVLKLMGKIDLNYYELQNEKGDVSRWGGEYDKKIIHGTQINFDFNIIRGPKFPLNDLFTRIYDEIDNSRFVNCAVKPNGSFTFHAYTIYGYSNDGEFLAISTDYERKNFEYIDDMKTRLINEQGSDILTFNF